MTLYYSHYCFSIGIRIFEIDSESYDYYIIWKTKKTVLFHVISIYFQISRMNRTIYLVRVILLEYSAQLTVITRGRLQYLAS